MNAARPSIFVTVGTQLPFDRLIRAIDDWAGGNDVDAFAQIGPSQYQPRNMRWTGFITPTDCRMRVLEAQLIVAHAGMGSILTAMECAKPIIIMPRRAELGEHRNDHQVATARKFSEMSLPGVTVAMDESDLVVRLGNLWASPLPGALGGRASDELLTEISQFLTSVSVGRGRVPREGTTR